MVKSSLEKYQQTVCQTASPSQLLLMLYDGAIRFVRLGIEGIEEKDIYKAHMYLTKSQSIIQELNNTLDTQYEVSENLRRLYEYMIHLLIQANIKKSNESATQVLNYLIELKQTWMQANKAYQQQRGTQHG